MARLRPRADSLAGRLSDRLRAALLSGLERRDADQLAHVLRVFATLDQVRPGDSAPERPGEFE